MAYIDPTVKHCFILLFRIKQQHSRAYIYSFSCSYTHIHKITHLPEPRTRTDKRKKLTPYAHLQSACPPSLREASDDRMMIAVRLFISYLDSLFLSPSSIPFLRFFVLFVRPHNTTNGRNTSIAF